MMYSAYKLNKQGDNIQPWRTPWALDTFILLKSWTLSTIVHGFLHYEMKTSFYTTKEAFWTSYLLK